MSPVTRCVLFSIGFLLALAGSGTGVAAAHRDGCHAQHSCPSDTGSYVCGDTGNYSECPGMAGVATIIVADPRVGATLSGSASWTAAPTSVGFQWTRDGQPVPDATAAAYVITVDDLGRSLALTASGTDGRGQSASASSTPVTVPLLAGHAGLAQTSAGVGTVLSATTSWNAPVTETYQWQRAGAAIPGANARTYLVTKDDIGRPISLVVQGTAGPSTAQAGTGAVVPTAVVALRLTAPKPNVPAGTTVRIRGEASSKAPVQGLKVRITVSHFVRGLWKKVASRSVTVSVTGAFRLQQRIRRSQPGAWKAAAELIRREGYSAAKTTRRFNVK